jgi:hypothetical protein
MKQSNITLAQYVAHNAPEEAIEFLKANRGKQPANFEDIGNKIQAVLDRDEEKALWKLMKIHPDRKVILAAEKMNADGEMKANDDGDAPKPENKYTPEHITNAVLIGSLVLISVSVFLTIIKP